MNETLAWGLDMVRAAQTLASPGMTAIMKGLSFLGSEPFFLLALPVIYWGLDRKRGAKLALVFLVSTFVNVWLKAAFDQPRPFEFDAALGLAMETSPGLPSGHAQGTMVFWGLLAFILPRPWGLVGAIAVPLLVGFSRVYLGVHFPTDVFAGWALGLVFVGGAALVRDRADAFLAELGERWRLILIAILAFGMNAIYRGDVMVAGAFLGAGFGFVWMETRSPFKVQASLPKLLLRIVVGLAATGIVYLAPKLVAPAAGEAMYDLVRFLRYALVGAWIAFGAPWLFIKLGLAESDPDRLVPEDEPQS